MTYSFNLVEQKWIPCVHFDGRVEEFNLREALTRAHELRGIQGDSPLETAAIYRLLLAVLHSALRGPGNRAAWGKLWANGQWEPDLVHGYLDKWHERFDLFHPERPFYQTNQQMENAREKNINDISPDIASANNATLFSHNIDSAITAVLASKAVRTIIVLQTMSIAGGWGMAPRESNDAPWGRGIIFLVEGDNLFKTLALNLLGYPDEKRNNMSSGKTDQPAWEQDDPYHPIRQIPKGYLDYLTWQNRRVLLIPEGDVNAPVVRQIAMTSGLRIDSSILDPMKLYRTRKEEGYYSTRFSEERALWRDSASLFGLKSVRGYFPPQTFYWLAYLVEEGAIPKAQKHRFMALGMANDQAKVEFFQQEHFPLPLEYLNDIDLVETLAVALDLAERTRFALKIASQWLALLVISPKSDGKKWQEVDRISKDQAEKLMTHWNVERFYWQQLDIPFQRFLEVLPGNPAALDDWLETVKTAAWKSLEQAVNFAGTDTSALKAEVRAKSVLGYSLKELFPEPQKEATA